MPTEAPPDEARLRDWAESADANLCVLFGSRAGTEPHFRGDVDLAVLFADLPTAERRLQIIGEAQGICGPNPVDLVFLHARTDPVLRFETFRTGRPVFERHPGLFRAQKVRALMLYEDALPFRRARRECLRAIRGDKEERALDPAATSEALLGRSRSCPDVTAQKVERLAARG